MDRRLSYIGANPDILDVLRNSQFAMEALAKLSEAVLGTATCVDGFTCLPTSPASLSVNVGPGQVYQQGQLEPSAISALPIDSHTVVKQGLLRDALTITLAAPATVGYAQAFLIEVQYADDDTSDTAIYNYYNAAVPDVPFTGPGGNNVAQTRTRKGIAQVQAKAGIAASSGTQVTPTPDAGWAPLFIITLAYGQTTITAGNIAQHPNAPFIPAKLNDASLRAFVLSVIKVAGITTYNNITPVRLSTAGAGSFTASYTGPHRITGWGAGAGGGYSGASSSAGGGGGAGGSDVLYVNLVAGVTYNYVIGAPGAGGTNAPTLATSGGTTSFNGVAIASGGSPGANAGSTNQAGAGGGSGTGLLGRSYSGSPGYQGYNAGLIAGGQGGNAPNNGGTGGASSLGNGNLGYGPGGGGGGGGGNGYGGNGAAGGLLIEA